jgi:hypothetical protein
MPCHRFTEAAHDEVVTLLFDCGASTAFQISDSKNCTVLQARKVFSQVSYLVGEKKEFGHSMLPGSFS